MLKKVSKNNSSLIDKVEKSLKDDGIALPRERELDEGYLNLPREITEVGSKDLGEYLNSFTQQKIWIRTVIGRASLHIKEKQLLLDKKRAVIYSNYPAKMSIKEKELYLLLDSEAEKLATELMFYEEKLNTLNDIVESLEESIFVVSREISRRGKDWDEFNRGENSKKSWGRERSK